MKYWRRRHPLISGLVACLIGLSSPLTAQDSVGDAGPASGDEAAASAEALLDRFATEVSDMSAEFVRTEFEPDGEQREPVYSGEFALLRPGRFRWHELQPEEILYVADGESLWTYDVEFEQVSRQPARDLADNPAMQLLSGEQLTLDAYAIRRLEPIDNVEWLELTPTAAEAGRDFESARIGFDDAVPVAIELVDGLGILTRIEFSTIEVNTGLAPARFEFEPPAGVDVDEAG